MNKRIETIVIANDVAEKVCFKILIPYSLIQNTNFLEVMETYQLTDPIGWLNALANFIQNQTENNNG